MPRIMYCSTPAGRVAYSASGTGLPLLVDSGWITDLRGQLELYSVGPFIAPLAERLTVIRYDKPGCGLSDRTGIDLSFDGQVAAALAVADVLGASRFRPFRASQGRRPGAGAASACPGRSSPSPRRGPWGPSRIFSGRARRPPWPPASWMSTTT